MSEYDDRPDRGELGRRLKSALAVLLSLVVLVGGGYVASQKAYGMYMDWRQTDDYIGAGEAATTIVIPAGASVRKIGQICVDADVVRSSKAFEQAAAKQPKSAAIQPGTYNLKTKLPAETVISMLIDPANRVVKRVTIREGLRVTAIVPILVDKTGLPAETWNALLTPPAAQIGLPAYAAGGNPEGYLFPDTYEVGQTPDALAILKQMTARYAQINAELTVDARAKEMGMTTNQIMTVASIIEAEVFRDEDRPKVARAIYNRLNSDNHLLQLDTTVNYATGRSGHANLRDGDTAIDSPYNTYKYPGLPPTPIVAPGKKSIEAALSPADGNWKFWVAVNLDTGETKFADTFAEHQKNVQQYQDWCRANAGKCG